MHRFRRDLSRIAPRARAVRKPQSARTQMTTTPWAPTWEARVAVRAGARGDVGRERRPVDDVAERGSGDAAWFHRRGRASLSPAGARDLILMNSKADVRELLPSVQSPTLVLHRTGDRDSRVDEGRYIGDRIACSRFVELPGDSPLSVGGLRSHAGRGRGVPHGDPARGGLPTAFWRPSSSRTLVRSTERARDLGDAGWSVSGGAQRDRPARARCRSGEEIEYGRRWIPTLFDGPARSNPLPLAVRGTRRAGARGSAPSPHRRSRATRRGQAARDRNPQWRTDHVARGRRRGIRQLDDARSRCRLRPRLRGSWGAL